MRVSKAFQPITITLETQQEAKILLDALDTLIQTVERRQGSWWSGYKDKDLTGEQKHYRTSINQILWAIDPSRKERPMFMQSHM